jgi:hypothetical protein
MTAGALHAAIREWASQAGLPAMMAAQPAEAGYDPEQPLRVGDAPAVFSTCTALEPWPIADVNSYYAELGVDPRASRPELKAAYLRLEGHRSERLTYVLSQLLDPVVRRQYDLVRPGRRFWDKYEAEEADRQLRARMAIMLLDHDGDEEAAEEAARRQLAEDDRLPAEDADLCQGKLDSDRESCQDGGAPPRQTPPATFPWGHYLWRSPGVDDARLAEWQRLVVRAAAERGIRARIAVGACGRTPHRMVLARVGRVDVVFLNDGEEPTEEVAEVAAEALHTTLER